METGETRTRVVSESEVAEIVRRVLGELEGRESLVQASTPAKWPPSRIAIGADHGGVVLKDDLAHFLKTKGFAVLDCGTHGRASVDYPDFAAAVARRVRDGDAEVGIVIDTVGIGSAIAANKIAGVRCALCHDVATVLNSRRHNDANVLSLGAHVVSASLARRMVDLWLRTEFAGDRHLRRLEKIRELEA